MPTTRAEPLETPEAALAAALRGLPTPIADRAWHERWVQEQAAAILAALEAVGWTLAAADPAPAGARSCDPREHGGKHAPWCHAAPAGASGDVTRCKTCTHLQADHKPWCKPPLKDWNCVYCTCPGYEAGYESPEAALRATPPTPPGPLDVER